MNPKGIILTGGPNSCMKKESPTCSKRIIRNGYSDSGNLLWITAYDAYAWAEKNEKAEVSEYGKTEVQVDKKDLHYLKMYPPARPSAG